MSAAHLNHGVGRALRRLIPFCAAVVFALMCLAAPLHADITLTGSNLPAYDGTSDPWDVRTFMIGSYTGEPGTLTIDNGSIVNTGIWSAPTTGYYRNLIGSASDGLVIVRDEGSALYMPEGLHMGSGPGGPGAPTSELQILDGGYAEIGGEFLTGFAGRQSDILVRGNGSRLNITNPFSLGLGSTAGSDVHALVDQGGTLDVDRLSVGLFYLFGTGFGAGTSYGGLTVDGEDSTYIYRTITYIGRGNAGPGGYFGDGKLTISGGATATTDNASAAYVEVGNQYGTGELLVTGAGSQWLHDAASGYFRVGAYAESVGLVRIEDGGFVNAGTLLTVGTMGTVQLNGGLLEAVDIDLDGLLKGVGNITASLDNITGRVAPGFSTGLLEVTGNYTQSDTGTLTMELTGTGGTPGVDFDQLLIHGTAALDGILEIPSHNGYQPPLGSTYDLLIADTITDSGLAISSLLQFEKSIIDLGGGGQALRLTTIPEPASAVLLVTGAAALIRRRH